MDGVLLEGCRHVVDVSKSFTPEFKVEAARRVIDGGRPVSEVGRKLNIHESLPGKWGARNGSATTPVAPVGETVTSVLLGRDYYVLVVGNDFSVEPAAAIGQLVEVRSTLAEVIVARSGRVLALHQRCWAARQTGLPRVQLTRGV